MEIRRSEASGLRQCRKLFRGSLPHMTNRDHMWQLSTDIFTGGYTARSESTNGHLVSNVPSVVADQ